MMAGAALSGWPSMRRRHAHGTPSRPYGPVRRDARAAPMTPATDAGRRSTPARPPAGSWASRSWMLAGRWASRPSGPRAPTGTTLPHQVVRAAELAPRSRSMLERRRTAASGRWNPSAGSLRDPEAVEPDAHVRRRGRHGRLHAHDRLARDFARRSRSLWLASSASVKRLGGRHPARRGRGRVRDDLGVTKRGPARRRRRVLGLQCGEGVHALEAAALGRIGVVPTRTARTSRAELVRARGGETPRARTPSARDGRPASTCPGDGGVRVDEIPRSCSTYARSPRGSRRRRAGRRRTSSWMRARSSCAARCSGPLSARSAM